MVRVIERQDRGKNCPAAIFTPRQPDVSLGPLGRKTTQKSKDFLSAESLKSLGKKGKTLKKARKFLATKKSKEIKKARKGRSGLSFFQRIPPPYHENGVPKKNLAEFPSDLSGTRTLRSIKRQRLRFSCVCVLKTLRLKTLRFYRHFSSQGRVHSVVNLGGVVKILRRSNSLSRSVFSMAGSFGFSFRRQPFKNPKKG